MSIDCVLVTPPVAPALAEMTFPLYRQLMASSDPGVVAIAAMKEGQPIALVLARFLASAELLSLYVSPSHRRQGVGRSLLAALEAELNRRGCRDVATTWIRKSPGVDVFADLLQGQGWSPPQPRMILYLAERARLAHANWILGFTTLPPGHTIVPWSDVTPEQIQTLRQAIRFEGWVPAGLIPFDHMGTAPDGSLPEPQLNLACIAWGEVVGWNFAHRLNAHTVRATCTYVRTDLQQHLLMLALWREFFLRLADTEYREISWGVFLENKAMVAFNDKYMSPYLSRRSESWGSRKNLG